MNENVNAANNDAEKEEGFCFKIWTGKQVQDAEVPETNFLVDGLITPGFNILAAPRKRGKSWMALDLALCVAGSDDFLGRKTKHGKVLYFALEDNEERMKRRIDAILDDEDVPENLLLSFSTSRTGKKFFKDLDRFLQANEDVRLIIIDVLQKIRMDKDSNQTEYAHDYHECSDLKEIADKHGMSVLVVHHTRKTKDSDPLNEIAGGVGITATADTILQIRASGGESQKQNTLFVIGRDMPEQKLAIVFDPDEHKWKYVGTEEELNVRKDEEEYAASPVMRVIKALIEGSGRWTGTISDLVRQAEGITNELQGLSASAISRKINKFDRMMAKDGIVHTRPDPNGGLSGRKHVFARQDMSADLPETGNMDILPASLPAEEEKVPACLLEEEMQPAGWTAEEMQPVGWTAEEMQPADWTEEEMQPADWTAEELDGLLSAGMCDEAMDEEEYRNYFMMEESGEEYAHVI